MAKWISGATCAAALLSVTLAAAQTAPQRTQSDRGRVPDKPSTTSEAGKVKQQATITGCVVRDAANGGEASIASNGISYRLTGKDEKELEQYLGKRVEVTGLLESGSGARATSGKANVESSIPPKDQTATGGQSDVTATGTPRDNTVPPEAIPLSTDKGTTADLIGRVQVKTLKVVSPNCL
jgi:hypothetical protein